MPRHYKKEIGDRVREALVPLIGKWQAEAPQRLLPTSLVITRAVYELGVSGGAVRKHLTNVVADETVIEILVRRDWLVVPPDVQTRFSLYAVPDGELYQLTQERPDSRGSAGVSFLTTVSGYHVLLDHMSSLRVEK